MSDILDDFVGALDAPKDSGDSDPNAPKYVGDRLPPAVIRRLADLCGYKGSTNSALFRAMLKDYVACKKRLA